ncbi:hypothetical protein [Cryptosporangium phraense]|uniref:Uncharacterized protein n=1 Tax=Cryptosporangium phraense TaxID=2593070 RepID=A0A545AG46_9ACTN|nr:hypothetical protein [Cryptosporangium phraense]TQS40299.1 hypothetical protein FL583_35365 [Cryptosporangium phraense]
MHAGAWSAPDTTAVPAFFAAANSVKPVAGPGVPPPGCTDPDRWTDAYLISEAHRAENGVCRCGRPLPCIAAQRADEIMAETTAASRAAEEVQRAAEAAATAEWEMMHAITQEIPVIRVEPEFLPPAAPAPVGARFRSRTRDEVDEPPPAPAVEYVLPEPRQPTGARFYRERKSPRHRS